MTSVEQRLRAIEERLTGLEARLAERELYVDTRHEETAGVVQAADAEIEALSQRVTELEASIEAQ